MKKLLAGLAILVCVSCAPRIFAQGQVKITPTSAVTWSDTGLIQGDRRCVSLKGTPAYAHSIKYDALATTSAVTMTFSASTDGSIPGSTLTTKTNTAGDTYTFTGVYTNICVTVTTLTGTGAKVSFSYTGDIAGTGSTVTITNDVTSATASAFKAQVVGTKTHNANAPAATDIGALTCLANAAAPTLTEGDVVYPSCDLSGGIRLAAQYSISDLCDGSIPSIKRYISVGSTEDESQVKATAGTLCHIQASNANATTNAWIKCTNLTAANTTPGSSAVFWDMLVPFGLGNQDTPHIPFSVALTCYIVTGNADSDATEVGANDVHYVLEYQ